MKRATRILMVAFVLATIIPIQSIMAQRGPKIELNADQISGYSDPNYTLDKIIDGNTTTYWKSVPQNGYGDSNAEKLETRMEDHNRYINIKLDGLYNLDEIKIFNQLGSSNNYYIYASEDGTNYDKIVSKTDSNAATKEGDTHPVNKKASYIRLNMAYNSATFESNLAEIEVYGTRVSETVQEPKAIEVASWEGSDYQKEWDKFESDSDYANSKTIKEVQALVGRVIGEQWISKFKFELRNDLNGNDVFELENGNGKIIVRGNDGVSLASGFNYYLKNYAMVDYNPLFDSNTKMDKLVKLDKKIVKETQYDVRYALNFCTYSYSMAFWGWDEYQEFIDWAAMNGVNVMLDIVGQEEVLRQTLKQYNYTDEEIKEYIAGPGYFAWFYMQNLYSFGGPLPDNWFEQRVELGRKMHDRMQAYGIDPVIQGFSGQVPLTFDDKNEGAVLTPIDEWPSFTRPAIIKTYLSNEEIAAGKKDYFKDMSKVFYDAQKNVFGDVSDYYACDPFHEGGNTAGLDITNIFSTVQTEMLNNNEDAIWVLQQWQGNLSWENLSGLVKPEQALALDLQTDKNPSYGVMESYNVPWVWNMLHNFGGRMGLDGEIGTIATSPAETAVNSNASHMVGIGITPEALENSPVVYELLFDMTWSSDPIDSTKWVEKYAERRAGGTNKKLEEAWEILVDTAYSVKKEYFQGAAETVINARPSTGFSSASTWGHSTISYEKTELDKALKLLIENYDEFSASPAYRYDLADVAEQVLCNAAIEYHKLMVSAYNSGDSAEFKRVSDHYLELISLSDDILGSSEEFMLGTWINDARTMLDDADDWTQDLFEFNARALVTTWGGQRSSSLKDYSNRKWAGLTETFYKERWAMWISNRQAELDKTSKDPVAQAAESNWFLWEWQWANRKSDDGYAFTTKADYSNLKTLATKAYEEFSATSLKDFGSGEVEDDINIAEGKLFVSDPVTSEESRKKLTDGTTSSEWKVDDTNEYTLTLDLEGTYEVNSVEILLQQLAVDFIYNYKVEIMNASTGEWQEVEANAANDTMSSQTIVTLDNASNKEATQVRITMKTRDAAVRPLLITEIKVMGKALNVPTYYNVAKGLSAESTRATSSDSKITNITDDDVSTLWKSEWSSNTDSMFPTTVTLDLKNTYDVNSVELYFEKVGLPFKFKVIAEDESGNETVILDKTDNTSTLEDKVYKIKVDASIRKVKVLYEGTTKQGASNVASPAMAELKVLSLTPQQEVVEKANQALNKPVTASSTQSGKNAAHVNDGNTSTVWNFDGYAGVTTASVEINLQGTYSIEELNLQFKDEGYEKFYKFEIYVMDKNNKKIVVYSEDDESVANKKKYNIALNQDITKVGVSFKGKKADSNGWFDIAELEAIGTKSATPDFIFGQGQITSVTTDDAYKAAIDGDATNTFIENIKDKEVVFDLGSEYYLEKADFTFEKGELGLCYMVYVESNDGVRTVVSDASNATGTLGNKTVSIKVNRNARKVIFKHLGNNGDGPAYLAAARLYEAEFYMGTPEDTIAGSTISNSAASALMDGDENTSYKMTKQESITFDFAKATDVNIIHLVGKVTKTKASDTFKVEAYDLSKQAWVTLYDGTNGKVQSEYIIVLDSSIYTNKIRLTSLNDGLEVNEFKMYEVDVTQTLVAYIKEVRDLLATKRYDDNNGSYKPESKAAIEALLSAAETKISNGMSSIEVEAETATIKAAVKDFNKNGIIYVDRTTLLSNINYAKVVIAKAEQRSLDQDIETLKNQVSQSEALYAKYDATQTAINAKNAELETSVNNVYVGMDVDSKYDTKKKLAESLIADTNVGDKHGYVSQATLDNLTSALAQTEVDYASGVVDKLTVLNDLETNIATFNKGKVVVNKANLLTILDNVATLKKAEYDFTTWSAFQSVLSQSKTIYDTEAVSQAEVETATSNLNDAKAKLVVLKKVDLRRILDNIANLKSTKYTSESWNALMSAYDEANILFASDELTQAQIDEMFNRVNDAKNALVEKAVVPNEGNNANTGNTTIKKESSKATPNESVGALAKDTDKKVTENKTNKDKAKTNDSDKDMSVEVKGTKSNDGWIYGIAGIGVIALVGVSYILNKKKKS